MDSSHGRPTLRVGRHLSADDGACLMELVSVAAGEPWGDRPACTHPLLAHVARRVNDTTSDDSRSALTSFIPALARARADGAWVFANVADACTGTAIEWRPSAWLRLLNSAAATRAHPEDARRRWLYVRSMAYRSVDLAVFAIAGLERADADLALRCMLSRAVLAVPAPSEPSRRSGPAARHHSAV